VRNGLTDHCVGEKLIGELVIGLLIHSSMVSMEKWADESISLFLDGPITR
jgi:hypothetical protein